MSLNLKSLPKSSGIYKFFSQDKIIYIGKAKNLKKRVSSYFGASFKDRKTQKIKQLTDKIETFSTSTEAEALLLEQSLIKENLPRFNILLRDDKTYPYIHFSLDHKFPGISMKRSKHAVSKNFVGPFISAQAVKSTIKDLQKIYKIRNCSDSTFKNRSRPCIEHQMRRCSAPCVGLIDIEDYQSDVFSSQQYLASTEKEIRSLMNSQMQKLANLQEFERANELKKRIRNLDLLKQEQSFNSALVSVDIFACASKLDRTGVCIISIRDGKIRGTKTHFLRGNQLLDLDSLFQSLIFSYYQNIFSLPEKIVLTLRPNNLSLIKDAIKLKFGKTILISSNINSENRQVVKLAKLNANQVIENRMSKADKYSHAISDLISHFSIDNKIIAIEGIDVSHHGGKNAVASVIRFSMQGPDKSFYRLFNIPKELSGNDVGSIKHVLKRRINRAGSMPLPDIFLIDGGKPQLDAALSVLSSELEKKPIVLGIVKGSKRVRSTETIISEDGVLEISKDSPSYILLQQIRDESHRFAIAANRKKKNKGVRYSSLDKIVGLGPQKKKNLLKEFKSLQQIKAASIEEICLTKGISIKLANQIKLSL